jgi:hypothetical protein
VDLNHGFSRRILALKKDSRKSASEKGGGGVELGGVSKVKKKTEIGG